MFWFITIWQSYVYESYTYENFFLNFLDPRPSRAFWTQKTPRPKFSCLGTFKLGMDVKEVNVPHWKRLETMAVWVSDNLPGQDMAMRIKWQGKISEHRYIHPYGPFWGALQSTWQQLPVQWASRKKKRPMRGGDILVPWRDYRWHCTQSQHSALFLFLHE